MKRPKIEDYKYGDGENNSLLQYKQYADALDDYIDSLEAKPSPEPAKILQDFLDNNEAEDALVSAKGVMLSQADCLTLMNLAIQNVASSTLGKSLQDEAKECLDALSYWDNNEFKDAVRSNHKLEAMRPMILTKKFLNKILSNEIN